MSERDFSRLPDVAWVNVMSRLELDDRSRVSRTCCRLNEIFQHPSLWHTVRIVLLGDLYENHRLNTRLSHGVFIPERYVAMIRAFGGFFQNVELLIVGYVRELTKACRDVITELANSCRLQSLTLDIGDPVNVAANRKPPLESDLKIIGSLVSQAFRLKSLSVTSWPIYSNHKGYDILRCLRENEQIRDLERLRLFERDAEPDTWFPRNTTLPPPDQIQQTVASFAQLTCLGLHADLITEPLMLELSNLKRFTYLKLLLIHSGGSTLGHISSSCWQNLATRHPFLNVDATLGNTLPSYEFIEFFKSEVPLTSICFSKYARYQQHILDHLSANYSKTLKKFQDFGDGLNNSDSLVLCFARRCTQMNRFVYSGPLKDSTILALAELKGQNWTTFEVKLQSHPLPENDDEDEVIGVTSAGDFYVKAHQPNSDFYHADDTEELQRNRKQTIVDQVSKVLQKKWAPIGTVEYFH